MNMLRIMKWIENREEKEELRGTIILYSIPEIFYNPIIWLNFMNHDTICLKHKIRSFILFLKSILQRVFFNALLELIHYHF
jgi:hypothetical protein